jgi:hypothetical protein
VCRLLDGALTTYVSIAGSPLRVIGLERFAPCCAPLRPCHLLAIAYQSSLLRLLQLRVDILLRERESLRLQCGRLLLEARGNIRLRAGVLLRLAVERLRLLVQVSKNAGDRTGEGWCCAGVRECRK